MPQLRPLVLIALLVPVLGVSACTAPTPGPRINGMPANVDISAYADVHAVLNREDETMVFPIDAFFIDPRTRGRILQANALLWDECMRAGGRSYPPAEFDLTGSALVPDTNYGIWSADRAARFGYGMDPSDGAEMEAANAAYMATDADPGWEPAFEKCTDTTALLPEPGRWTAGPEAMAVAGPAKQVASDAYVLATADPDWDRARSEWSDCLVANGLRLRSGEESPWGPEVPEDPEEAIRTAVLDVQCKEETGLVETLSSLEAQYQAALIDQNRAAMDEVAEKEQEIIAQAEKILAEHGR
ncbi:flagellar protein FlgN [Rathayibacter sp. ZW T2_19]|uniref:Flagellar protein FlgN n=1 Tax=Rathayibacter rubneri TaxID=2950106 RepID=A0A9X2IUS3_9MICO|nr:flagellar protein FlgN [Rathayibacter rubneri]MCM6762914.1 flagellar protein FlgN [Rathayibacter rubneri]